MKTVILDDEKFILDELEYVLSSFEDCEVVGAFDDSEEMLKAMADLKPDVAFVDINLGSTTGFDVAEKLLSLEKIPYIVFATAYDEYAIKAFEYGAIDYVLKPFDDERIKVTIDRISKLIEDNGNINDEINKVVKLLSNRKSENKKLEKLPVLSNGRFKMIDIKSVYYIKAKTGTSEVFSKEGNYMCESTLSQLEERLGDKFMRIHKSYIINLDMISEVIPWFKGTYWVVLSDPAKTEIPVSKERIKEIKDILF